MSFATCKRLNILFPFLGEQSKLFAFNKLRPERLAARQNGRAKRLDTDERIRPIVG